MRVQAISIYKSSRTGTKKDGTGYGLIKCLDDANDTFCNFFCDVSLVDKIQRLGLSRNDEIMLTLDITIGFNRTYVSLIDVSVV